MTEFLIFIVAENALNSEGRGDDVSPTSLKMQSLTEEERRAARKRRQQQKQEEFRQIYQQKRRSVPHEMSKNLFQFYIV